MEFRTVNPATGEVIRTWRTMASDEVMQTARRARDAFNQWGDLSVEERVPYFQRLAKVLRDNAEQWAVLVTTEMGKPVTEAKAEIEKCAWMTEVYAANAAAWLADEKVVADGLEHIVTFQPLGVIFSIMPWNYPFWQALRFAVPGLMAGNTSLLKHASNVTGCAFAIEDAFVQAGFPDNVFRTIVPDYETVSALIASDNVQGVSLTGSTQVGRHIGSEAGRSLKKVVLELGGSDPFIILEDAEIDFTARGAVTGRMVTAGQSCIASKRFIVVEKIVDAFTRRFTELMKELKVGDPLNQTTQVGSLVNEAAISELEGQLAQSVSLGARVLCGGERLPGRGFFFPPTVVTNTRPGMRLVDEEVFGPIAPIITVKDEAEAISLANSSEFGLGGSVWTRDLARGVRVARQVESGTLFVNSITKSDPRMPFGGVKNSGLGRELSHYGLKEFVNVKGISLYKHG
ncbi:MAG: NAD-dependent succinate-semialdehyde dehydrogenase [Candidatus Krumholzibacteria bacterium]|nr:NAD-dependent succinate-semialdehyde dehydrogenase [Candidatus Krumholzibacteria bacterium]